MKRNISEGKQGLKSRKLFDLIKLHGGFREKSPSFYLHDMTDDDIVGVIDKRTFDMLFNQNLRQRAEWVKSMGYVVNHGDDINIIPLKDNTQIVVIERGGNLGNKEYLSTPIGKKLNDRYKNTLNRGDRNYQWSDTGKWGSSREEEFHMRKTQNNIANQRRQRYGDDAVYKVNENDLNKNNKNKKDKDMSKVVLNENELQALINESVVKVINEAIQNGELDEISWQGFTNGVKNVGNQFRAGYDALTQDRKDMGIVNRVKSGAKSFKAQGQLNDLKDLQMKLKTAVDAGEITPNMTVAQLIGVGKGSRQQKGNKGSLQHKIMNRQGQLKRNGSNSYEE